MKSISIKLTFIFFLIAISISCNKGTQEKEALCSTPEDTTNTTVGFASDVLPIFNTHCNGPYCHGIGADGKYYDTYSNVIQVNTVTLLGAINHTAGYEPMPQFQAKLRQGEIDTITTWINEGRLDN